MKCPGQDLRYWKPEDIFSVSCPECGESIEFFKDEMRLRCPNCKKLVPNPKADLGCAGHCASADDCVGPELAQQLREQVKPAKK